MMIYSTVAINVLIFYFLGPLSTHIATSNNLHPGTLHGHHSSRNYDLNEATPYEADDNIEGPISSKRYLESIASDIFKRDYNSRVIDPVSSDIFNKETEKRLIESIGTDIFKKSSPYQYYHSDQHPYGSNSQKLEYLQRPSDSLQNVIAHRKLNLNFREGSRKDKVLKFNDTFDKTIPHGHKRFLESIASDIFKKDSAFDKRFLDEIASSLVKRVYDIDPEIDLYSVAKEENSELTNKRYIDEIANSLIKKDDGEKRYFDGIASSLVKKDDGEKRHLDGIASSLIKKDDGEKRHLDGIARSLVKKDDGEKRYFDGIASSLVKKEDGEKRYFEDIASSLIKRSSNSATHSKRMYEVTDDVLDGSRISKRTTDGVRGWRESEQKETDDTAPKLRHRRDVSLISVPRVSLSRPRRFIDSTGSDIFKRQPFRLFTKAHVDPQTWHSWGTYKPHWQKTKSNEGAAKSLRLLGKRDWLDHLGEVEDAKMDDEVSRLYLDQHENNKRHLDSIASSLLQKRYLDTLASSLVKRSDTDEQGFADGYFTLPLSREIYFRQPLDVLDNDQERFEF